MLKPLLLSSVLLFPSAAAQAQIVPDSSLGSERSQIAPRGSGGNQIEGGAVRGANLFHSFSDFNVGNGQQIYFANPIGIQNIFTRVTGTTASNINGTLGVDGAANLFLLNPNGILFGQNARLDIRGSFVGSTANAIQFGTQGEFSATQPQATPLLTVQPSALVFRQLPSSIELQPGASLEVPAGQTIGLIGGNLNLDGAIINAPSGNIALAGIASPTNVGVTFSNGLTFSFEPGERADIAITQSILNVAGDPGGSMAIQARNLDVSNSSVLNGGIVADAGDPAARSGDINIQVTGATSIRQGGRINTSLESGAQGNSGNITLNTGSLSVTDASTISTLILGGVGTAGDVTLNVRGASIFDGRLSNAGSTIASVDSTGQPSNDQITAIGIGETGKVRLTTGSLTVSNGAKIGTLNLTAVGKVNDVTIDARDRVVIQGADSAIGNIINRGVGTSGDVTLSAGSLRLRDGASLISTTETALFGQTGNLKINVRGAVEVDGNKTSIGTVTPFGFGIASDVYIAAGSLSVTNGATIATIAGLSNQGSEKRGNITIETNGEGIQLANNATIGTVGSQASGDIVLSGRSISLDNTALIVTFGIQGNSGNITLTGDSISANNSFITAPTFGRGNTGKITIAAQDKVSLNQSGIATNVTSLDDILQYLKRTNAPASFSPSQIKQALAVFGSGGSSNDIDIRARSLRLNNSFISSDTSSGSGGNIRLNLGESLILRRSSKISTTAGSVSDSQGGSDFLGGGNGGNITIESLFIIAVPSENSKIRANA